MRRSDGSVSGVHVDAEENPMVPVRKKNESSAVAGAKDNKVRVGG